MKRTSRLLFFADVDLNLIDGSSIWTRSVLGVCNKDAWCRVDFAPKIPIERSFVCAELKQYEHVTVLEPHLDPAVKVSTRETKGKLTGQPAAEYLAACVRANAYDAVLVRGDDTAAFCMRLEELANMLLVYTTVSDLEKFRRLRRKDGYWPFIVCQTEAVKKALLGQEPSLHQERVFVLPPMVPDLDSAVPSFQANEDHVCYVGKLDRYYLIEETISAIVRAREMRPSIELHVAGDKFHLATRLGDKPIVDFKERVQERLLNTPGVYWHGGLSLEKTEALVKQSSLGTSWRHTCYLNNLELSTKILEYGRLGKPVLMSPNVLQKELFGGDYSLFVDNEKQYVEKLLWILEDRDAYRQAATRVYEVAKQFTHTQAAIRLRRIIESLKPNATGNRIDEHTKSSNRKQRVLVAGHDLKFLKPFLAALEEDNHVELKIDQWEGHAIHNKEQSANLGEWADIIFCEWALGNVAYFSQRKRPDQRLIVRLHLQEAKLDHFLDATDWDAVDQVIFICHHVRDEVVTKLSLPPHKHTLIYNMVDVPAYNRPKNGHSDFALGLMGICPARKDPIFALDLLRSLRERDPRFCMTIKGKKPEEYDWLWNRDEERAYYKAFYRRLELPTVNESVTFDSWGDNVEDWFSKVGFVLSTSEFEGSHQALAEGMASGAIPIMRNWEGVDKIYPNRFVFETPEQALSLILETREIDLPGLRQEMVDYAQDHFALDKTLSDLLAVTLQN